MRKPKPGFLWSTLTMRCPRCRKGDMFLSKNAYVPLTMKNILDMHDTCPVCKQRFHLEVGFWYGTGYVSYAVCIGLSLLSFLLWWGILGFSIQDNSVFYWLGADIFLLIILQPWIMRLGRSIYIRFFVRYDENYENTKPTQFS